MSAPDVYLDDTTKDPRYAVVIENGEGFGISVSRAQARLIRNKIDALLNLPPRPSMDKEAPANALEQENARLRDALKLQPCGCYVWTKCISASGCGEEKMVRTSNHKMAPLTCRECGGNLTHEPFKQCERCAALAGSTGGTK